jgi:hypothetical protein
MDHNESVPMNIAEAAKSLSGLIGRDSQRRRHRQELVERLEAFHTSAPDMAGPHDGFRLFR